MEINKIILGAFGYVYEYRTVLARALVIPFLILIMISAIPQEWLDFSSILLLGFISLFIYAAFAITVHRTILIGSKAVPRWGIYKLTKREFKFVLCFVGIGIAMIPISFFQQIPFFGSILSTLLACYIFSRLSLVFPAIATDTPLSFREPWNLTQNYQLPMLIIIIIFPLLLSIPETILINIPHTQIFVEIVSFFTSIFVVAALSVAFKVINENTE